MFGSFYGFLLIFVASITAEDKKKNYYNNWNY